MSEENEVEVSELDLAIRAAFDDNQGGEEEEVKMAMLQAGCKIKAVARMYNTFMIDSGQMATTEEKNDTLEATLPGMDLASEEGLDAAVESVQADITGATEKSASAMVRAWAKKNDVEVYKKPKGAPRTDSFVYKFNSELIGNPTMTEAECKDFIVENGTAGTQSTEYYFQSLRKLANAIYSKYSAEAEAA